MTWNQHVKKSSTQPNKLGMTDSVSEFPRNHIGFRPLFLSQKIIFNFYEPTEELIIEIKKKGMTIRCCGSDTHTFLLRNPKT